jgi:hypothetical protein
MDALALLLSLVLPWGAGCALLLVTGWPAAPPSNEQTAPKPLEGKIALTLGYGYFVGLLLLTVWMRILSVAGVGFGRSTIGIPLAAMAAAAIAYLIRAKHLSFARLGAVATAIVLPPLPRWQRILWIALLAWLTLRFATLATEIASRPLYPRDAWTQWATKARVWYALGHIVPFVSGDDWLLRAVDGYFDASPANPATIPLVQAWSAIALGRWDDTAMNWAWLVMLFALALAAYGTLRDAGVRPLGALTGAYLVSSLPLLDTHVALAGYPDLMLSAIYTLAALALHRWASRGDARDGVLALVLAITCPSISASGRVWMLTLIPGAIVATWPRLGLKLVTWGFGAVALAVVVLARQKPLLPGVTVHLHYTAPWSSLIHAYFLAGNWHLLWYTAAVLAVIGARRLTQSPLAVLATVVGSALAWLAVAFAFPSDIPAWLPEAMTINRSTLHVAPLLALLCILLWRRLTASQASLAPIPKRTNAAPAVVGSDA